MISFTGWVRFARSSMVGGRILHRLMGGMAVAGGLVASAMAQPAATADPPPAAAAPSAKALAKERALVAELQPELTLNVDPRASKLFRTQRPIRRIAVTNPELVRVVQYTRNQFEVMANGQGTTTLTIWFAVAEGQPDTLRYLVRIGTPAEATLPKDP